MDAELTKLEVEKKDKSLGGLVETYYKDVMERILEQPGKAQILTTTSEQQEFRKPRNKRKMQC